MLHLAQKIAGTTVSGTDGEIGTLEDFYFEEAGWNVRYLLVDTGSWFNGKRVLLSPSAVQGDWGRTGLRVNLSRNDVRNSPALDDAMPDVGDARLDSVGQDSWRIRYLLVDTSNWIGGRSVIVSSEAVERVNKADSEIYVDADRDAIKNAPALESIEEALSRTETGPPFTII
jgi:hypothetical protein